MGVASMFRLDRNHPDDAPDGIADLTAVGDADESADAAVADLGTAAEPARPARAAASMRDLAASGHADRSTTVADLTRLNGAPGRSTRNVEPGTSPSAPRRSRPSRPATTTVGAPAGTEAPAATVPADSDPSIEPGDPVATAKEICLRLLTDRARSRHELAQVLRRRGIPDEAADAVLSRFDEVGLIDDAAFAGQWVRSRHRHRGLARRAIASELRRKGIDEEVAGEALAEVDVAAEEARAHELVVRKLRTMPVATAQEQTVAARRLVGMLARKGYGSGVAYGIVRRALAERGAELDESDHPDG